MYMKLNVFNMSVCIYMHKSLPSEPKCMLNRWLLANFSQF